LPILEKIHGRIEHDFIKDLFPNTSAFVLAAMLMTAFVIMVVFVSSINPPGISSISMAGTENGAK
jgi:hypothetical protein